MFAVKHITDAKGNVLIQDPPIAQFLFQNTKASVIWLIVRLYLAYDWLEAGWHKLSDPAWMVDGSGILGFWTRAAGVNANGQPVIAYGWYRGFIQFLIDSNAAPWFSKVIVAGELLVVRHPVAPEEAGTSRSVRGYHTTRRLAACAPGG